MLRKCKGYLIVLALFVLLTKLSTLNSNAAVVLNAWSGALTDTSISINARMSANCSTRAAISNAADMSSPFFSLQFIPVDTFSNWAATYFIAGLTKDTKYYYAIEIDGLLDLNFIGTFKTIKVNEPYSFSFIASSCSPLGNNSAVFDSIRVEDPAFFFITGDFFYANIATNNLALYRNAYNLTLSASKQRALYKNVPIAYMWDDHDYGPNNSTSLSLSRSAAIAAYKENVPHYPLAAGAGEQPIYQSFTVGRVRFIVSDLRSAKIPGKPGTMMGVPQLAWFKQELLNAKNNNLVIAWMSSVPFISSDTLILDAWDNWAAYKEEREDISNFIVANDIKNIFILSGDAHMLAVDDGTNSDFSSTGNPASIPVFQAAASGSGGSFKGGPYSHGAFQGKGQYGIFHVIDLGGDDICFRFRGKNINFSTSLLKLDFCSHKGTIFIAKKMDIVDMENRLKVYPNPVRKDQLMTIEYTLLEDTELTIELVDAKGAIVFENKSHREKGLIKFDINRVSFNPGLYHVLVKSNIESISRKVEVK